MGWAMLSECNGERTLGMSTIPSSPELYGPPTPALLGPTGPASLSIHLSPSSVQCRHTSIFHQMSINQSIFHQMSINQSIFNKLRIIVYLTRP